VKLRAIYDIMVPNPLRTRGEIMVPKPVGTKQGENYGAETSSNQGVGKG
jgi:hypothetical protein